VNSNFYISDACFFAQLSGLRIHGINLLDLVEPWVFGSKKFEENCEWVAIKIVTGSMMLPILDPSFQTLLTELIIDRLVLRVA
jgi:hypothetical protein